MDFSSVLYDLYSEAVSKTLLELAGLIFSLLYVYLAARRNIACWWFGLASSIIYAGMAWHVHYYQDLIINGYYIVMSFVGFYLWRKDKKEEKEITPRYAGWKFLLISGIAGLIITGISGFVFATYTASDKPYLDGLTTVFAFLATWMGAKRMIENWVIFVIIDLLDLYLYGIKGFYFTALLYLILSVMAIYAYITWHNQIRSHSRYRA